MSVLQIVWQTVLMSILLTGFICIISMFQEIFRVLHYPVISLETFRSYYDNEPEKWNTWRSMSRCWLLDYSVKIDETYFRFSLKDYYKYRKWYKQETKRKKKEEAEKALNTIIEELKKKEQMKRSEELIKNNPYKITSEEYMDTKTTYQKIHIDATLNYFDNWSNSCEIDFAIENTLRTSLGLDQLVYIRDDKNATDYEIDILDSTYF